MMRIAYSRMKVQNMVAKVGKSFWAILGWMFLGDVWDFSWTSEKNNIQYSTIEFKVIDIVYIVSYSIVGIR